MSEGVKVTCGACGNQAPVPADSTSDDIVSCNQCGQPIATRGEIDEAIAVQATAMVKASFKKMLKNSIRGKKGIGLK